MTELIRHVIIQPRYSLVHYELINDNSNNKDKDNTNNEIITLKGYYEIYDIYKQL